jgi:anti-sigma B factor antagonist
VAAPPTRDGHLGNVHSITLDKEGRAAVVTASGELDAFVADELTSVLEGAVDEAWLVVDLTAVSFMDSTALGLLVRAVREADERGNATRVVLPATTARRIFEITTLDRVLPIATSRAQALAQLDDRPSAAS